MSCPERSSARPDVFSAVLDERRHCSHSAASAALVEEPRWDLSTASKRWLTSTSWMLTVVTPAMGRTIPMVITVPPGTRTVRRSPIQSSMCLPFMFS